MKCLITSMLLCVGVFANAQTKQDGKAISFAKIDASPVDLVYYPISATKVTGKAESKPVVRVMYSRPQSKGRMIFGNLIKYNDVWRFGANENTEIKFYKPVKVGGKEIPAGAYSLFAIPTDKEWTIIINRATDIWGNIYDKDKDVVRVKLPITKLTTPVEDFSITFIEADKGIEMVTAWDTVQVNLPIEL